MGLKSLCVGLADIRELAFRHVLDHSAACLAPLPPPRDHLDLDDEPLDPLEDLCAGSPLTHLLVSINLKPTPTHPPPHPLSFTHTHSSLLLLFIFVILIIILILIIIPLPLPFPTCLH